MARRPDRVDGHEQGVSIAVDVEADEPQDVAALLALAPESVARPRVEVDLAGLERRRERLGVHPGEHQDPAVGGVLDDRRRQAVGTEPHGGQVRRRHAAAPDATRTGRPAAAIAALTSPIEWIRRWKIEAARTASAPPRRPRRRDRPGPPRRPTR